MASLNADYIVVLSQEDFYNAWEEDIAVVNIFFGKETVMGRNQFPKNKALIL